MGVLGLTPFLQRTCPEAIKLLPDRLRSLNGKTIVIDGTLVTQRLHWAPTPHRYRHVLGWYRLATELKVSNVRAICVFDGKERSSAKSAEIERRRRERRVITTRSVIEADRLHRLHKLTSLLNLFDALPQYERIQARAVVQEYLRSDLKIADYEGKSYKPRLEQLGEASATPAYEVFEDVVDSSGATDNSAKDENGLSSREVITGDFTEQDLPNEDIGLDGLNQCAVPLLAPDLHMLNEVQFDGYRSDGEPDFSTFLGQNQIAKGFTELYEQFRTSNQNNRALRGSKSFPQRSSSELDVPDEINESKSQQAMTLDEGELWKSVASCMTANPTDGVSSQALSALATRSQILAQSYERRSQPPSSETYSESRMILAAMGIPCIQSEGPYEAEGLAASLVAQGHADFVASEDTDVLVYDGPLLRNITTRSSPLVSLSGASIRAALNLSRDSFIDFAILLGTDFSRRIKNVGPARALNFIRMYGRIEDILANEPQYAPAMDLEKEAYLAQVKLARAVFSSLPPLPEGAELQSLLAQKEEDRSQVMVVLGKFGLSSAVAVDETDWDGGIALAGNYFNDSPVLA